MILISDAAPHYPGIFQFTYTDYDKILVTFHCYNITGRFCVNFGASMWARDTSNPDSQTQQMVDQMHDTGKLCVNKTKGFEKTHTMGRPL